MPAKTTEPVRRSRGFTLLELVVVIVILGAISVVIVPTFNGMISLRSAGWRDEVEAALRHAQKSAVAHRRLVCVTLAADAVSLQMATANPAASCDTDMPGPGGAPPFARSAHSPDTRIAPAGVLYFQPDGRATTDAAGSVAVTRTISMKDVPDLRIDGVTGFIR